MEDPYEYVQFVADLQDLKKDPELWAEFTKTANKILQDAINEEVLAAIYAAATQKDEHDE